MIVYNFLHLIINFVHFAKTDKVSSLLNNIKFNTCILLFTKRWCNSRLKIFCYIINTVIIIISKCLLIPDVKQVIVLVLNGNIKTKVTKLILK